MELIKKISNKTLIPFVVAFIAILVFHFSVDLTTDDYKYFRIYAFGYYEESDVLSFLEWRYATWTSRVLIEFFTFWFVQLPTWVFAVVDSIIILLIVAMTYLLFSKKKGMIYASAAIVLTFMYRIIDQRSAGYLVTMIVYLWPLAAFIPTLFPFKKSLEHETNYSIKQYVMYTLCALFCCNCEQVCVAAILTWGGFIFYSYIQNKKVNKLYCLLLAIAFAHLAYTLTCPGNAERTLVEMEREPMYEYFGIFKKTGLCIASPISKYLVLTKQSLIVWAFSTILPFTLFMKNRRKDIPQLISMIPFGILCCTLVYQHPAPVSLGQVGNLPLCVVCALSVLFYGSIIFTLYQISKGNESIIAKFGLLYIFLVGLISRACLGFTISFQDTSRTYFLLEYAMIAVSILLVSKFISNWKESGKNLSSFILGK